MDLGTDIDIRIDELVLHGFHPGDKHRIARAVETELARLMAGDEVPPSLRQEGDIQRVDGGSFDHPKGMGVDRVGAQIARSVYTGFNKL